MHHTSPHVMQIPGSCLAIRSLWGWKLTFLPRGLSGQEAHRRSPGRLLPTHCTSVSQSFLIPSGKPPCTFSLFIPIWFGQSVSVFSLLGQCVDPLLILPCSSHFQFFKLHSTCSSNFATIIFSFCISVQGKSLSNVYIWL